MPSTVEAKATRWAGLDTLRAVAVFSVMLYHFPNVFSPASPMQYAYKFIDWFGWAGVDLFLVLSGFLIAHLLFMEIRARNTIDFARFWTRRAFKIYPLFYLMLLIYCTGIFRQDAPVTLRTFFGEAFFIQNYAPHIWAHTWSLGLEEHFYLIIGLLFVGPIGRYLAPRWLWVAAFVAITCLTLRIVLGIDQPFQPVRHLYPTHMRLDAFFIGSAVAYFYYFQHERAAAFVRSNRFALLLAGIFFLCVGFAYPLSQFFAHTIGLTCLSLGFSAIVATVAFGAFSFVAPIGTKTVSLIGRSSYAIYLWHIIILRNVTRRHTPDYFELFLYLTLALAVGIAMTKWVEAPCLALRERYFPRKDGTAPQRTEKLSALAFALNSSKR
jgi:peptidoglycan/LPS O-acetylase OafA/YrhL